MADVFKKQVLQDPTMDGTAPVKCLGSCSFLHIKYANVYVLAVTNKNSNASMCLSFIKDMVQLMKSYFGSFNEDAIRNNFVLVYELLDGKRKKWKDGMVVAPREYKDRSRIPKTSPRSLSSSLENSSTNKKKRTRRDHGFRVSPDLERADLEDLHHTEGNQSKCGKFGWNIQLGFNPLDLNICFFIFSIPPLMHSLGDA